MDLLNEREFRGEAMLLIATSLYHERILQMDMKPCITFTNTLSGTSVGALLIDSTKPCNLSQSDESDFTESYMSAVHDYSGFRFMWKLERTGDGPALYNEEEVMRVVTHILLERLPENALRDIWETVWDAWEIHSRPELSSLDYVRELPQPIINRVFEQEEEVPFNLVEE